jgi:putative DNA primase/helicase
MHFNKKIDVDNALARISDSVAFGALARHCFVATDDPENERRLLVKAKNNLAPDVKALSYTIRAVLAAADHRDGRAIYAPRIEWGYEHVEVRAVQAMRAENGGTSASNPRNEAKELLRQILPLAQKEVEERAKAEMISMKTLRRGKKELGVISEKDGIKGGWIWRLPGNAEANGF